MFFFCPESNLFSSPQSLPSYPATALVDSKLLQFVVSHLNSFPEEQKNSSSLGFPADTKCVISECDITGTSELRLTSASNPLPILNLQPGDRIELKSQLLVIYKVIVNDGSDFIVLVRDASTDKAPIASTFTNFSLILQPQGNSRILTTLYACGAMLSECQDQHVVNLVLAILVHAVILQYAPLKSRCLPVPGGDKLPQNGMKNFFKHVYALLRSEFFLASYNLLDLIDGRLLTLVYRNITKSGVALGLRPSMMALLIHLDSAIRQKTGIGFPEHLLASTILGTDIPEDPVVTTKVPEAKVSAIEVKTAQPKQATPVAIATPVVVAAPVVTEEKVLDDWDAEEPAAEEGTVNWEDEDLAAVPEASAGVKEDEKLSAIISATPTVSQTQPAPAAQLIKLNHLDSKFVTGMTSGLDAELVEANLVELITVENKHQSSFIQETKWKADFLFETDLKYRAPTIEDFKDHPRPRVAFKRAQQKEAKLVAFMNNYVKSLSCGKVVFRDVIVAPKELENDDLKREKKNYNNNKKKIEKKEDAIRKAVDERNLTRRKDDVAQKIAHAAGYKKLEEKIHYLDTHLLSNNDPFSVVPGTMQVLKWCMEAWRTEGKPRGDMEIAVRVFRFAHDIYRRFLTHLEIDDVKVLQEAMLLLGFEDTATQIVSDYISESRASPRPTRDDLKIENKNNFGEFRIGLNNPRFQLQFTGPTMVRNVQSSPDPRVDFYPDKWQKDLLDIVDAKKSALIIAPTSSGKTFISFYCMKQVILANKVATHTRDRGIVVYVCPIKSLCRQVSAEVYQRYGSVYGVFNEDYSTKAIDSEIIIATPSCFEYLMMCPSHEELVKRIKYVIFDEVHCIGQTQMDGRIWERLLLANRAPILALSATVGNPNQFIQWLENAERAKGREIKLIVHNQRWSDLEKYVYLPKVVDASQSTQFTDISKFKLSAEQRGIVPIHPCVALCPGLGLDDFNIKDKFPAELAFSPLNALELYDAMVLFGRVHLSPPFQQRLNALNPDVKLNATPRRYIDKTIAQQYVQSLKNELSDWNVHGLSKAVQAVYQGLSDAVQSRIEATEKVNIYCSFKNHFHEIVLGCVGLRRVCPSPRSVQQGLFNEKLSLVLP